MQRRTNQIEAVLVTALLCLAAALRSLHGELEVVEHFDEGVYASVLWYDAQFGSPWPGRDYFAPPGLPFLIELASLVPGLQARSPFLPGLVFGVVSPLVFWWLARFWFGRPAGLFVLAISVCSEFHVIYSRMALTDVPALCLVVAAVGAGSLAIHRNSLRWSLAAGFLSGLAWWLKYTGWLPVAIVGSGSLAWWLAEGRSGLRGWRLVSLLMVMTAAAGVTFAPCWWSLQSIGGYSAVAANHAGYLAGWQQWSDRLSEQLAFQMLLDGWCGAASLSSGLALAAVTAGLGQPRFTWNAALSVIPVSRSTSAGHPWPAVRSLWFRALPVAAGLGLLSLRIHTPVMLGCLALGGLTGLFLWPVLRVSHQPARSPADRGPALEPGSGRSLGFWLCLAWVSGLLLVTPHYQPYSRLMLPLLAGIWLAAAGGVGWWLECQLLTFGQPQRLTGPHRVTQIASRLLVIGLVTSAVGGSLLVPDGNGNAVLVSPGDLFSNPLFQDRRDIRRAAGEVAGRCVADLAGQGRQQSSVPVGTVFTASGILEDRKTQAVPEFPVDEARLRQARAVLCVYGEPALATHLHALGMATVPTGQPTADERSDGTAVFLIFGPNAKRTPGFWEQWQAEEPRFEWVGDVLYQPGQITLMDLFSAEYLSEHAEALQQRFEIYRVRSSDTGNSPRPAP